MHPPKTSTSDLKMRAVKVRRPMRRLYLPESHAERAKLAGESKDERREERENEGRRGRERSGEGEDLPESCGGRGREGEEKRPKKKRTQYHRKSIRQSPRKIKRQVKLNCEHEHEKKSDFPPESPFYGLSEIAQGGHHR
jgi:hypothetical protein